MSLSPSAAGASVFRFAPFELDPRTGDLRKAGVRVPLQDQSFRVLLALLQRPGELVSRDALRHQVWADDTFVDFDQGLNTAIKRLRDALGDVAETPRFIETLPRRGYRFIAPVEVRSAPIVEVPGRWLAPMRASRAFVIVALALLVSLATLAWKVFRSDATSGGALLRVASLEASIWPARGLFGADALERSAAVGALRPSRTAIALSPDGQTLVFSGSDAERQQLYVRSLNQPTATAIAGTDGADGPFFSPDGAWIGFWADRKIKKVALRGGPTLTVCETSGMLFGATWTADGRIIFAVITGGLLQVSASGGVPSPLTTLGPDEASHRLPHALPGDAGTLFTSLKRLSTAGGTRIEAYSSGRAERKVLVEDGTDARYIATGHLVFARDGALFAAPFDASRLEVTGPAVGVLDDVMHAVRAGNLRHDTGSVQVSISQAGALAYVPGGAYPPAETALVWVERGGRTHPVAMARGDRRSPRLSPDNTRVVMNGTSPQLGPRAWVLDLERQTLALLPTNVPSMFPFWTKDGLRVTFSGSASGVHNVFRTPPDGGAVERLTTSDRDQSGADWAPDGTLILVERDPKTGRDVWAVSHRNGISQRTPLVQTAADDLEPMLSPDGRWLAYASYESGRSEVYVQAFPGSGARHQISTAGGHEPVWSHTGAELFYIALPAAQDAERPMMAVTVRPHPTFWSGRPKPLFDTRPYISSTPVRGYDVSPEGRFLMTVPSARPGVAPVTQIRIVLNWVEELRSKMTAQ